MQLSTIVEAFHPSTEVLQGAIDLNESGAVTYTGKPGRYTVISGPRTYAVQLNRNLWECQCLAFTEGRRLCKHALAAMAVEDKYPTLPEPKVIADPFQGLN